MLDIGLFEVLVIGCVGLFVIGPEKLPGTIKTCALWIGRIKRNLLQTRQEIEKHIGADEIRQQLRNEQVLETLERLKETRKEIEGEIEKGAQLEHDTPSDHTLDELDEFYASEPKHESAPDTQSESPEPSVEKHPGDSESEPRSQS